MTTQTWVLLAQTLVLAITLVWIASQTLVTRRLFGTSFSGMIEERMAALTRLAVEYPELGRLWDSMESAREQELRERFYCCLVMDLAELIEAFRRSKAITKRRADRYLRELVRPIATQERIRAGIMRAIIDFDFPISDNTRRLLESVSCVSEPHSGTQ